jgi:hypothetical protein
MYRGGRTGESEAIGEIDDIFKGLLGREKLPLLDGGVILFKYEKGDHYTIKRWRTSTGNGSDSP